MPKTVALDNLSVRKQREYATLAKEIADAKARQKAIIATGSSDIPKLCKEAEKELKVAIRKTLTTLGVPSQFMRRVVANAVHAAIPKSTRGRKPLAAKEDAA